MTRRGRERFYRRAAREACSRPSTVLGWAALLAGVVLLAWVVRNGRARP